MKTKLGRFKDDIYVATGRYPIDTGQNYTKDEIDEMFELTYKKGTMLFLEDDAWWLAKDGDGGWNVGTEFAKLHIEQIQ